jgi:hypothetical protein
MALLRDVPFVDYETDEKVRDVIAELNKFPSKTSAPTIGGRITAKSLLRGGQPGSTVGPYVSQFFLSSFCARRGPAADRARRRDAPACAQSASSPPRRVCAQRSGLPFSPVHALRPQGSETF